MQENNENNLNYEVVEKVIRQIETPIPILNFPSSFHRIDLQYNALILILVHFWYDNINATEFLNKVVIFINRRGQE